VEAWRATRLSGLTRTPFPDCRGDLGLDVVSSVTVGRKTADQVKREPPLVQDAEGKPRGKTIGNRR